MSTTFAVVVQLVGVHDPDADDPEVEKLCAVLGDVTRSASPAGHHLAGGGGYGDPERFPDERADVALLLFQKNDAETGDLVDCDDADRHRVGRALLDDPRVETFLVGPLDPSEAYDDRWQARLTSELGSLS